MNVINSYRSTTGNPLLDNIISAWQYNGNANDSVGSNNGTAFGGVTYTTGVAGDCGNFTGGAKYITAPSTGLNFGNGITDSPFSVSTWVKFSSLSNYGLVTKGNSFNVDNDWVLTLESGSAFFRLRDQSTGVNFSVSWLNSFVTGTWYHIVATYDTTTIRLYIDNVLKQSESTKGSYVAMEASSSLIHLGDYVGVWRINGYQDETFIFDKCLTVDDIDFLYTEQLAGNNILI